MRWSKVMENASVEDDTVYYLVQSADRKAVSA
jgi:hypothetical protein